METRGFWRLEGVSDLGLQEQLTQLLSGGSRTEAHIVAHIAEVGRRRLFSREGFSTLHKYCQERLGLSEVETYLRTTAARIARKYPVAFGLIEERKIHLSGLCKLSRFLTRDNHLELLWMACGKTKLQVEEALAARFPGSEVKDSVRRLPVRPISPVLAPPASTAGVDTQSRVGVAGAGQPGAGAISAEVEVVDPNTGEVITVSVPQAHPMTSQPPERSTSTDQAVRYRVQFEASAALKAKIELALALSSHANPTGDLATLFERALDGYVEELQKKRFGKTDKPRSKSAPSENNADESRDRRAHIPHETRREVVAKDGLRCAYVSAAGHRCDERAFLQLHHDEPWARRPDDSAGTCASTVRVTIG